VSRRLPDRLYAIVIGNRIPCKSRTEECSRTFEQQVHFELSRLFSGDHQGNLDSLLQGALISRSPLKRMALALTFISLAAAAK